MTHRFFLLCGIVLMILGVSLGAFGAHALKQMVAAQYLTVWQTATDYLFYHALGLIGLALWSQRNKLTRMMVASGLLMLTGVLLFCGSLYLMVLTGNNKLGMITPLGGLSFIAAWAAWLLAAFSAKP